MNEQIIRQHIEQLLSSTPSAASPKVAAAQTLLSIPRASFLHVPECQPSVRFASGSPLRDTQISHDGPYACP